MDNKLRRTALIETARVRDMADALLRRLVRDRSQSEQRLAEIGQRDAMKSITGRSAMDNVVITTAEMIRNMDAMIQDIEARPTAAPPGKPARREPVEAGSRR